MNNYYVYGHYYNGALFYIGKGIGGRYKTIKSRTQSYFNGCNELSIDIDKIEYKILAGDLTGDNALALEAFLIDMYISQGFKLINIREADLLHAEYRNRYKDAINEGIAAKRERGGYKLTHQQLTQLNTLTANGVSKINIAKQLGVSRNTIYYYLNKGN